MAWPCLAFFGAFKAAASSRAARAAVLRPATCSLLSSPDRLHPLLSASCVSDHGCVCAAIGVSAGRLFFTLCFHDDSAPCPLFFSLSLLIIASLSYRSGSYLLLSCHSWRVPRLHICSRGGSLALPPSFSMQLRSVAVRMSFGLAVPGSGAASLAGQVSMRFAFGFALLLPATFTSVCCRYSGSFPFSFLSWPVFPALISAFCRSWALAGGGQ